MNYAILRDPFIARQIQLSAPKPVIEMTDEELRQRLAEVLQHYGEEQRLLENHEPQLAEYAVNYDG
jgi:hypothetical protein